MNRKLTNLCIGFGVLTVTLAGPAYGQQAEEKPKPPLYTYVADFSFPRGQWAEWNKTIAGMQKTMESALADGSVVAFGSDRALVHTAVGFTHDDWWCSTSMAGLMNTLDQVVKGTDQSTLLASPAKHADQLFLSHHYNWKPGPVTDGYIHSAVYMVKPEAPRETVESLSKSMIVPLLEKLFADGSISAYQVATEAIHTENPGVFYVFYICPKAEGLDKVNAALMLLQSDAKEMSAFDSVTDSSAHRDGLAMINASFK